MEFLHRVIELWIFHSLKYYNWILGYLKFIKSIEHIFCGLFYYWIRLYLRIL